MTTHKQSEKSFKDRFIKIFTNGCKTYYTRGPHVFSVHHDVKKQNKIAHSNNAPSEAELW